MHAELYHPRSEKGLGLGLGHTTLGPLCMHVWKFEGSGSEKAGAPRKEWRRAVQ